MGFTVFIFSMHMMYAEVISQVGVNITQVS